MPSIYIVTDNYQYNPAFRAGSGFACIVKTENTTILFDTGTYFPTVIYNMGLFGFKPEDIDIIVISHIDVDHIGGLSGMLDKNPNVTVYIPISLPSAFKDMVMRYGSQVINVDKPREIVPNIETSGEMGKWVKEQSLILKTPKGMVLLLGDAHSGIITIIEKVMQISNDSIYLVIGGYSMGGSSTANKITPIVNNFIKLGIEKVAPCHSSGDMARQQFNAHYKENYIEAGAGKIIEL
jgi:7,8-dihydropterin-6-yl-methyl-4-(beta-D-ribofuranosyl)aminobenzene 5'-phosphate synthase